MTKIDGPLLDKELEKLNSERKINEETLEKHKNELAQEIIQGLTPEEMVELAEHNKVMKLPKKRIISNFFRRIMIVLGFER